MKAIVQTGYGSPDFLSLAEVPRPEISEKQVLVKVQAVSLNAGDYFSLQGSPWMVRFTVGFPKPKNYVLGWDIAGVVEAVGDDVTSLKPGDEVFGGCSGGLAEYACTSEKGLTLKPKEIPFMQAAALPTGGLTALQGLRDHGKVQPGQKVLINGASGGVGTFAVQIGKALGAEVTGVCSTRNVQLVRSLGADHVFDYTQEDFTQSGRRYDLILDNVASRSFSDFRRVLTPEGMIIPNSGHGGMTRVIKTLVLSPFMKQLGGMWLASTNAEDLNVLKEFVLAGKITPVIDRTYPLKDTAEAFRYLIERHAQGKVVITL